MTTIDSALENVTVVGAAGKMGRGIALLLLQECAVTAAKRKVPFVLKLIDTSDDLLATLPSYLYSNLKKYSERNIVLLRQLYADNASLVSNSEILDAFLSGAMQSIRYGVSLDEAKGSRLVFEAIVEDIPTKVDVFKKIKSVVGDDCFFFTNTSSIPIHLLSSEALLHHRLIGFHFYNPPAIQKLIEIIPPAKMDPDLLAMATSLAGRLNKTVVLSADVAGFIGNGHFIPELHYACTVAAALAKERPLHEALYIVNTLTHDLLIRPMGIFQLADYVGLDVCRHIAGIMDPTLIHPILTTMLDQGITGGQYPDGSQRPGFFEYSSNHLAAVYDVKTKAMLSFADGEWVERCRAFIGPYPEGHASWKQLQKATDLPPLFRKYFFHLFLSETHGCRLAKEYLLHSKALAQALVDKGIAHNLHDVGTVLKLGFYHLYGPDDPWIPESIPQKDTVTHAKVKNESFRRSGI